MAASSLEFICSRRTPALPAVRRYLRELLSGKWQKVIKKGDTGEVHYFEHESGQVAGVKFFSRESTS